MVPTYTPLQDTKGDTNLLGQPSKVGGFNFTTGIVLYSAFLFAFLVAIGFATMKRSQIRKKFRFGSENQDKLSAIEAGHAGAKDFNEKGDGASKMSSDSRKPLTEAGSNHEIGRNARLAEAAAKSRLEADETNKRPAPAEERRQEPSHARSGSNVVRFEENGGTSRSGSLKRTQQQPSYPEKSPARRASARKNTASPDVDSEKCMSDSIARYQDDLQDTTDFSVPALTASTLDDNPSIPPQVPRPIYQQAAVRPSPSKRAQAAAAAAPAARPPRAASHGLVSRSGSSASQSSTRSATERDYYHGRSASSGSATLEHQSLADRHPTSIKRSNSSRLPPSMRVGTPSANESGTYM